MSLGAHLNAGFLIGGVSGGATFATIIAHLVLSSPLSQPVTGVLISTPILSDVVAASPDSSTTTSLFGTTNFSVTQNASAPLLDATMTACFWDLYQPDLSSALYTPFLFRSHVGHPSAYLQACGLDPFRDGTLIYDHLLRKAGTRTKIDIYAGVPHGFWAVFPSLSARRRWAQDTVNGVEWLLKNDITVAKI